MKKKLPLNLFRTAYRPDQLLDLEGAVVLFMGRSNVGKSSLLNAVTGASLAKVSKAPGKTRSVNYYRYGPRLTLVDLPGYGYAKRNQQEKRQWAELMKEFFDRISRKVLAYILMDAKRDLEEEELLLLESLLEREAHVVLLLTKADRLKQKERKERKHRLEQALQGRSVQKFLTWGFVSVRTGEGVEELRREIYRFGLDEK